MPSEKRRLIVLERTAYEVRLRQAAKDTGEGQTYECDEQDDNRGWHAPGHGLRVTILMAVRILFR